MEGSISSENIEPVMASRNSVFTLLAHGSKDGPILNKAGSSGFACVVDD